MKQLKITKKVTHRDEKSIDSYLNEISKYELISADDEAELARRIKTGDIEAFNRIIRANLRFVISVAKQYQFQGLTLSDLISEGNIGLIKAAKRFDETKGFKFISYAVWWIRQSILQAIAEHSRIVRLPLNKLGSINKVNQVFNELFQKFEREPTPEEIAKELELFPDEIIKLMADSGGTISMDAPVSEDEDISMYDILVQDTKGPDNELLNESLRTEVKRVLSSLSVRDADIIRLYYGLNDSSSLTLEEIGEKYNLTRERVRQIKDRAMDILKRRSNILKKFL